MSEFFYMGGYAWYVWPAYAFFFVVLALNWWDARQKQKRALRRVKMKLARQKS